MKLSKIFCKASDYSRNGFVEEVKEEKGLLSPEEVTCLEENFDFITKQVLKSEIAMKITSLVYRDKESHLKELMRNTGCKSPSTIQYWLNLYKGTNIMKCRKTKREHYYYFNIEFKNIVDNLIEAIKSKKAKDWLIDSKTPSKKR